MHISIVLRAKGAMGTGTDTDTAMEQVKNTVVIRGATGLPHMIRIPVTRTAIPIAIVMKMPRIRRTTIAMTSVPVKNISGSNRRPHLPKLT